MSETVHRGRWTREDRAAESYRYLPVDVPRGAGGLAVTLRYDRGAGVLDLGCFSPAGFRGWSGGARSAFAVGVERATPGYLPGPLEAGSWHVIIGLHRVGPAGVEWTVTARTGRSIEALAAEAGADLGTHSAPVRAWAAGEGKSRVIALPIPPPAAEPAATTTAGPTVAHGAAAPGAVGPETTAPGAVGPETTAPGAVGPGRREIASGSVSRTGPQQVRPARRELPAAGGMRWLAGDLHAHTVHSDGALTVPELATLAYDRGLDFLAVTDHNTISHHTELSAAGARAGVLLIPGQEVTTDLGHANAFGDVGWVDFRQPADSWLAEAERSGGLLSVNHPLAADNAWRQPMRERPPLAEVWHWTWLDRRWGGPLAWWLAWHPGAVPVGGSDFHRHGSDAPPGSPTTWVACSTDRLDADPVGAVLDGLRAGRVAVTAGPADPTLLRIDAELVAVDADGLLLVDAHGRHIPIRGDIAALPASTGAARVEDHDGTVVALCG